MIKKVVVFFAFAFLALLSVETCYASEINGKYTNYKREFQYAENKLENSVPESAVDFANDNFMDILETSQEYDMSLTLEPSNCRLGEPFIFVEEGNNEEIYRFPVIENNKVVYLITVINTDNGYTISGSTEYVDTINRSDNMESTADKISLRNDEDITELIKMLKDFKDNAGLEKITEAVNYVEGIENVLNGIGQRLDRLQHELDSVKEQNDLIMSRADRTMKDSLKEQVQKSRDRLNDMWKKVIEVMNAIKLKAHEIVDSVRHNGRRALKKTADILHIRKGLERVRFRADKMIAGLAGLEDKINDYKEQRGQAASERSAPMMEKETDKDMDNKKR